MRIGYIVFILIVSCGPPHSDPQVVVDFSKEKAEIIFARPADNGQFCFYSNSVEKELLPPLFKDRERVIAKEKQKNPEANYELVRTKFEVDFSKVSEGSTLLTERTISSRDLISPLISSSKWTNIASKTALIPLNFPLVVGCGVGFFLPAAGWFLVACVPIAASITFSFIASIKAEMEGARKRGSLMSPFIYSNDPSLLQELRKIFQWLESENSTECPKQPRIES